MRTGAQRIAYERKRQREEEGWTAAHDNGHDAGELARAAACYALPKDVREQAILGRSLWFVLWPWGGNSWKPGHLRRAGVEARVHELTKAGAFIAAEIDRLQREQGEKQ